MQLNGKSLMVAQNVTSYRFQAVFCNILATSLQQTEQHHGVPEFIYLNVLGNNYKRDFDAFFFCVLVLR
jgi:hypothetical protein